MADSGTKISVLPAADTLTGAEIIPIVQSSATKRTTSAALAAYAADGLTKSDVGLGNVANVLQYSASNPPVAVGTISLSASWSGAGPYSQTVTVTGATVTSASKVDVQLTAAQIASLIADGVTGLVIENNSGILTAWAVGAAPSVAMTVQCSVEETA